MSAVLRILKAPVSNDISFNFTLHFENDVATERRVVGRNLYRKELAPAIRALQEHVNNYKYNLVSASDSAHKEYRDDVSLWIDGVSLLISEQFLPDSSTGFAKLMREVEASRSPLLIVSNDVRTPWWLARSYSDLSMTWTTALACGFLPVSAEHLAGETQRASRQPISLLSRPSLNLRNASDTFDEGFEAGDHIEVLDGRHNAGRDGPGFGLLPKEIVSAFEDSQVVFYYGHFNVDETDPERSWLETLPRYPAGRQARDIADGGTLELADLQHLLDGKVLFMNGCRSVGLPYLARADDGHERSDAEYPSDDSILPHFYAINGAVCLGTLYPIFDDAAVKYMSHLAVSLTNEESIGDSMRAAQEALREAGYGEFDWSPYVLIGNPELRVKFDLNG